MDSFLSLLAKVLFALFAVAAIVAVMFTLVGIGMGLIAMLDAWLAA